jgi:CHAD domain-containing protein
VSTIESRLARLETLGDALLRDVSRLDRDLEAFAPLAGQIIEFVSEVRSLKDDLGELKDELKSERRQRAGMSTGLKVALIAGCFGLAGTLVAALAQILSAR